MNATQPAPKSDRTIVLDGATYRYLRTETRAYSNTKAYVVECVGPMNAGVIATIYQWAQRPDLYGAESNGCAFKCTFQMVNGKLVDRTADFARAEVHTGTQPAT